MAAINFSDWISLISAFGTIAAVVAALFMHISQVRSSEAKEKRVSALASFRVASSIFTLLSQIRSVQLSVRRVETQNVDNLDIHREFLELSEYCQAISNSSIAALSIFDHKSAVELAEGLGKIESLANKVKVVQKSDYWKSSIPEHRDGLLSGWDDELTSAFFKIENSTSFMQHLSATDHDVESGINRRRDGRLADGSSSWLVRRLVPKSRKAR